MQPQAELLPPAIAVLGPTGAGKSDFALRLASELPVEIISVDSAQVYRGMDIGTAKPTAAERARVPHHLLDIRDPEQGYSAGEFRRDCLRLVSEIGARGRLPLLVGGTMLYFRALFTGIAPLPRADAAVRARLDAAAARLGWPALHAQLAARDPAAAARIHPNDSQRIQRALEVLEVGGRALDELWRHTAPAGDFARWVVWSLVPQDRAALHARLEQRLDAMLAAGFVQEVRALLARGTLTAESVAFRTVGYRQLLPCCDGREPLEAARLQVLQATRQLAKRQLTWLRAGTLHPTGAAGGSLDPFAAGAYERFRAATRQALGMHA